MCKWVELYDNESLLPLSKTGELCNLASSIYDNMRDELIDEFGISENFSAILRNNIEIELYYADQIATGDRSSQIFIDILRIENAELGSKTSKMDLFDGVAAIEKQQRVAKDALTITVWEYYNYSRIMAKK